MWERGEEYKTADNLIKNYICTDLRVSQGCQLWSRWCLEITSSGHLRGRERSAKHLYASVPPTQVFSFMLPDWTSDEDPAGVHRTCSRSCFIFSLLIGLYLGNITLLPAGLNLSPVCSLLCVITRFGSLETFES